MRNLILIILGAVWFQLLFWQENLGVNTLIFSLFAIGMLYIQHDRNTFWRKETIAAISGLLIMAGLITYHNTILSKVLWFIFFIGSLGLIHLATTRSFLNAFWYALFSFIISPIRSVNVAISTKIETKNTNFNYIKRWIGYSIIPIFILPVFFGLYYMANAEFALLFDGVFREITAFFNRFFAYISLPYLLFFFIGISVMTTLLIKSDFWTKWNEIDTLERRTKSKPFTTYNHTPFSFLGLISEYRTALILFGMLNLLLLTVNLSDIRSVWFADMTGRSSTELKNNLHDGTYILILSIFLAMFVVGYFFRKNLNFYTKNTLLKQLVFVWIAQNAFLVLSVLVRNLQYIQGFGLAYKRIGVLLFLIATLVGLATMVVKVAQKKTFTYLLRINTWSVLGIMSLAAFINWDMFITRYNINHFTKEKVDYDFLINGTASFKNLPLIWEKRNDLNDGQIYSLAYQLNNARSYLDFRNKGILSWNKADKELHFFLIKEQKEIDSYIKAANLSPYLYFN